MRENTHLSALYSSTAGSEETIGGLSTYNYDMTVHTGLKDNPPRSEQQESTPPHTKKV
jgi:hypothetical protein